MRRPLVQGGDGPGVAQEEAGLAEGAEGVEVDPERPTHVGDGVTLGVEGLQGVVGQPLEELVLEVAPEIVLVGEPVVDGPLGDAGGLGDVLDGHRVVAALGEELLEGRMP